MTRSIETRSLFRLLWLFLTLGALSGLGVLFGLYDWTSAFIVVLVIAATLTWLAFRHLADLDSGRRDSIQRLRARTREAVFKPGYLRGRIVEGITVPLILLGPDKRVIEANKAAREVFGSGLVNRDITLSLRHPNALDAIDRTMESGQPEMLEITLDTGAERTYTLGISLVMNKLAQDEGAFDSDGRHQSEPLFYIVISMTDITKVKNAEQMRADFVANSSHELRTPLSSLIGFIETLRGPARGDLEASDRFLSIMAEEADRMIRLIDDLLSLSRIELERHVRPEEQLDISPVCERVIDTLRPTAQKRKISIDLDMEDNLPLVRADQDQIIQVLQNLLSNAIKYGRDQSRVTLRLRRVERIPEVGGPGMRIDVIDQGEGIPAEHLPRLTERFYRIDTARSRKMGGTGLGLAIVKHIVNRHRGHLTITSALGVGTTVSIWLPLYVPPEANGERAEPEEEPALIDDMD